MSPLILTVTLGVILGHGLVMAYAVIRERPKRVTLLGLLGLSLISLLVCAAYLLPTDWQAVGKFTRGYFVVLLSAALLSGFGMLVITDIASNTQARLSRLWIGASAIWGLLLVVAGLLSGSIATGSPGWLLRLTSAPDLTAIVTALGLLFNSVILLGIAFYIFYEAVLPEVANRALYWVLNSGLLTMGIILITSGTESLAALGMTTLLLSITGVTYALSTHRVFDIRGGLSRSLTSLMLLVITGVVIFMSLYAVTGVDLQADPDGIVIIALLAVLITLLYVPVRQILELLFGRIIEVNTVDPAHITREFSQQVTQAAELSGLAHIAATTLNRVMGLRRSGLMLVNSTDDAQMELLVMPGGSFSADMKGVTVAIPLNTRMYRLLAAEHRAITQFDIEFNPLFRDVPEKTRKFFVDLHMNAYAPIIVDQVMIGLLVCGPKLNDTAYASQDLELLTTLAQQTGFALRNARFVADLRHLNASMRSLNRGLEEANRELERLDSVKSDFVTIASHELRTPLAQIRGYTDIVDALNEQGMLDQEQTTGLVANLRKATERMEELISAMLDVSQLDVNAMDLRFARTLPETALKMAIEPLTDPIKQRKLTLSARGLRGLPYIHADLQRLVQAFRNIVVNAIKFTPDGGRIEITASLQPAKQEGDEDHILVTISDTGVGIDPANLDLVFKKFFRTYDPSLHSTGTYKFLGAGPGLGLTIAKGVIEGHGGKLWAESPGHSLTNPPGTTFFVLLPVNPPADVRRVVTFETNMGKPPLPMRPDAKSATDVFPVVNNQAQS